MLFPKVKINKNFIYYLWFRYIFLSYKFLYFYNFDLILNKNIDIYLSSLIKNTNIIGYKVIFSLKWFFSDNAFKFLKGKLLLLFSNIFYILPKLNDLILYAICFNNFFINSYYFNKLNNINIFYNLNFYFIIFYKTTTILYIYYILNFLKYIINIQYLLLKGFHFYFFNVNILNKMNI